MNELKERFDPSKKKIEVYVDKEIKEEIRIIKDIAAGAVLVWGIGFFASEFFLIIMAILGVLNW